MKAPSSISMSSSRVGAKVGGEDASGDGRCPWGRTMGVPEMRIEDARPEKARGGENLGEWTD